MELDEELRVKLATSRLEAEACHASVVFTIAGETLELLEKGAGGKDFHLRNADFDVLVGDDHRGYRVVVEARAVLLATEPLPAIIERARSFATSLADGPVEEERVRRLDLCADVAGVPFNQRDVEAFVGRANKTAEFAAFALTGAGSPRYTGFCIGQGGPIVRLYDKVQQLRTQFGLESEKWQTESAAYKRAGWNGRSPIWRLEAQIQGKGLDELSLRDPTGLGDQLDPAWRYLFGAPGTKTAWFRLVELDTASRRERCDTDPRWKLFQSACFQQVDCLPAERVKGSRGGASFAQVAGTMRGALAARKQLPLMPPGATAEEVVRADCMALAEQLIADEELLRSYVDRRDGTRARYVSGSDQEPPIVPSPLRFVGTSFDAVLGPLEWPGEDEK